MKISILTMQKNEILLLEAWIKYYSYLTTYDNILILDNGSTDDNVLNILKEYEQKGIKVLYQYNKSEDFENKANILKDLANTLYKDSDFVFFFDIDEFLFLGNDQYKSFNKNDILNDLASLPKNYNGTFKIKYSVNNIPNTTYYYRNYSDKVFFRGGTIRELYMGFHEGFSKYSNEYFDTHLGFIHMHNRPYTNKLKHAKEIMKSRIKNIDDKEELKKYTYGRGVHIAEFLLKTEEEYYKSFENLDKINISEFRYKMKELGIVLPY